MVIYTNSRSCAVYSCGVIYKFKQSSFIDLSGYLYNINDVFSKVMSKIFLRKLKKMILLIFSSCKPILKIRTVSYLNNIIIKY